MVPEMESDKTIQLIDVNSYPVNSVLGILLELFGLVLEGE